MVITYYGKGYIKVVLGEMTLAFNPPAKNDPTKPPRFGSDITLVSANLPDFNNSDLNHFGDKQPVVFAGPGEYEAGGVFIRGIATVGPKGVLNTVYSVTIDDTNLCHLGALASVDLGSETKEALGEIDILFVPTTASGLLEVTAAHKLATTLEPAVVVPLFYDGPGKDTMAKFLKEEGENVTAIDKFVTKKKDLSGKEGQVVVIKSW